MSLSRSRSRTHDVRHLPQPKVALIYDRVNTPYGGAENVLVALHQIFPQAPLFTSVYDPNKAHWAHNFSVTPSFLQRLPFARAHHRLFAWAMPLAFESHDLTQYDVVISITSAEAKGVLTKPNQLHICYLLTPTRYLWSHTQEYQKHWLSGGLRKLVFGYLRWWDRAAHWRPDYYIPISQLIADRCQQYYARGTQPIIYPPVNLSPFQEQLDNKTLLPPKPLGIPKDYYLVVARLVPYKKIDLAIRACQKLGRDLVIIGQGPDYYRLRMLAARGGNATAKVFFLQAVQPSEVIAYYSHCRAFLLLAEEDFGITALEAQACGRPVLIYHRSGAAEVVKDGVTGFHFFEQTTRALVEAMYWSEKIKWNTERIRQHVLQYDVSHFQQQFKEQVTALWTQHLTERNAW